MSLKEKISADLKEAMKARDQHLVETLRSVISAFGYKKVEKAGGAELTEEEEIAVLAKQVKQRNDAITEFTKAGRSELVDKESRERDILTKYLPAQKDEAEIRKMVQEIIDELPADARNQGAAMKAVMPKLKGQADGNLVRQIVTSLLQGQ